MSIITIHDVSVNVSFYKDEILRLSSIWSSRLDVTELMDIERDIPSCVREIRTVTPVAYRVPELTVPCSKGTVVPVATEGDLGGYDATLAILGIDPCEMY